jgi:hypothetical protein
MSLNQVLQYLFTNTPEGIIISSTSLSPLLVALSLALPVVLLFVSSIILPSLLLLSRSLPLLGITVLGPGSQHLRAIFLDLQEAYRRQDKAQYNTTSHIFCYYCHHHYHYTTTTTTTRTTTSLTRCLPLLL